MGIRETGKSILREFLKQAVQTGELKGVFVHYDEIMGKLEINNREFFMLCIRYLIGKGFIHVIRKDDDNIRMIEIFASAVDFLET